MSTADDAKNPWDNLPSRATWLPGSVRELVDPRAPSAGGKRTARDIAVDVLMVLVAAGVGLLADLGAIERGERSLGITLAVGLVACLMLVWRRRWPLAVALFTTVLAAVVPLVLGPAIVALFSLAVHRPVRYAVPVGVLGVAAAYAGVAFGSPGRVGDWAVTAAFAVLISALVIGWGAVVRNRRALVISLAELARHAESTQQERIEGARAAERSLLAREMHDVLAHRMSLISIHAGAIEFRSDASADEIRQAAGVIRAGVHQMLVDLRDVIDILRDETDRDIVAPLVSLAAVGELFDDSARAGSPVDATIDLDGELDDVPGVVSRAAYRVVQEGLTNARKHGGAVPVSVLIRGAAGRELVVVVEQPTTTRQHPEPSAGGGYGLTGLAERVLLAGGVLDHRIVENSFVLTATLPWERTAARE